MSGRPWAHTLALALVAAALAGCWYGALQAGAGLSGLPQNVQLRYHASPFTVPRLGEIMEAESRQTGDKSTFTAFGQRDNQTLEGKALGSTATANVLLVYGDMRQVLPPRFLAGDFPPAPAAPTAANASAAPGCALDEDTAYRLWGSRDVLGQTLVYGGKEYTVRGVFEGPLSTVALPVDYQSAETLGVLALDVGRSGNPRQSAEEFRQRHGLPDPDAVVDTTASPAAARLLVLLPALVCAAALLWLLARELWGLRGMPVLLALWLLALGGVLAAGCLLSGVDFTLPQSLIPTKWSDFEFWQRLIQQWGHTLRQGFITQRLAPDVARLRGFAALWAYSGGAVLCLWLLARGIRRGYVISGKLL